LSCDDGHIGDPYKNVNFFNSLRFDQTGARTHDLSHSRRAR
jgi:hypothetical protein